jgi:hypothetical protein
MRHFLYLSLATPVLLAQAPAAPAPKAGVDLKALEALRLENPVEAFARAKAFLPASRPPFDRANLPAAFASIREWNSQLDLYRAVYDSGVASGRFEEAREVAVKARDMAADLQKEALAAFNAYKATWEKAGEESSQALAEMKALEAEVEAHRTPKAAPAKPDKKVTMEEANAELVAQAEAAKRLAFLKANETTLRDNVEKAKKVMAPLERPLKDLETRTRGFEAAIAQWDKYLQEEAEDIAKKYKGDKATYAAGLLRGVAPKPENKEAALVALHRATVLDPRNVAIQKRIAQLRGHAAAPAPTKAKAKKGRA